MISSFCTFVFNLASTAKVISEHRPINVVRKPGIEPVTLKFQDNHEAHYATEATISSEAEQRRAPPTMPLLLEELNLKVPKNNLE